MFAAYTSSTPIESYLYPVKLHAMHLALRTSFHLFHLPTTAAIGPGWGLDAYMAMRA